MLIAPDLISNAKPLLAASPGREIALSMVLNPVI
jgi:hypothetical protein